MAQETKTLSRVKNGRTYFCRLYADGTGKTWYQPNNPRTGLPWQADRATARLNSHEKAMWAWTKATIQSATGKA